jgi:hypothetical protein
VGFILNDKDQFRHGPALTLMTNARLAKEKVW